MKIAISAVVLLLSGCVSYGTTLLRNKDGKTVTCGGNWGFGLGAPVAVISHKNCLSEMHKAGFYEIGKPIPPDAPAQPSK